MIYTLVRKNNSGTIDAVFSFDSISSFDESWGATVTTQTVEKGFNISDNITIDPESYDIKATISSYSLFDLSREIVWDGENFTSKSDSVSVEKSHITARDTLVKIFKDRSILTLLESSANSNNPDLVQKEVELKSGYFKDIDNCVITSLSISTPESISDTLFVSLKIQKVHVASVLTVQVEKGQMVRTLVGLDKKSENVGSDSSKADKSDVDDGSVAIQPEDNAEGAPATSKLTGRTQRQKEIYLNARMKPYETLEAAWAEADRVGKLTKRGVKVVKVSGGYRVEFITGSI